MSSTLCAISRHATYPQKSINTTLGFDLGRGEEIGVVGGGWNRGSRPELLPPVGARPVLAYWDREKRGRRRLPVVLEGAAVVGVWWYYY